MSHSESGLFGRLHRDPDPAVRYMQNKLLDRVFSTVHYIPPALLQQITRNANDCTNLPVLKQHTPRTTSNSNEQVQ